MCKNYAKTSVNAILLKVNRPLLEFVEETWYVTTASAITTLFASLTANTFSML